MAFSFSSDHYLRRNFLNKTYLLCMYYDVGNRLENEKENDEEPNSTYEHLQIAVILLLSFLENRRMWRFAARCFSLVFWMVSAMGLEQLFC